MNSYEIIVKNEKIRSYNRLSLLILVLHLLFFIYYLLKAGTSIAILIGIAGTTAAIFLQFTGVKKNERPRFPAAIAFLLLAVVWFMLANYWLTVALILLAFADLISMKKPAVLFFADRIEILSFPKKTIRWNELNNVILKDRILTIDFRSDKLMQAEIAAESYHIDELLFNRFCIQQLQNKD